MIRLKLERSSVEAYFDEDDTEEAIQEKVLEALEFYRKFSGRYKEQLSGDPTNKEAEV